MTQRLQNQLEFLEIADGMKQVFRQTTLLDGSRYENNAEHSWHFALMAMTLFEHCVLDGVDIDRVVKMAIVHDLVEIYAGDTPAQDVAANIGKQEREREAADRLFALLPAEQAQEYRSLWEEFDAMSTPDAIYASAVDRFQSFQLIHRSGTGSAWVKFNATTKRVRDRMLPVKTAIPALWQWIESAIEENVEKGLLIEIEN
ncbi:MAG: HD domain-containing protein [Oscillospiraceae bacterium]|nr:HD domain-containing protein [Oscillospiraceae bacterium]